MFFSELYHNVHKFWNRVLEFLSISPPLRPEYLSIPVQHISPSPSSISPLPRPAYLPFPTSIYPPSRPAYIPLPVQNIPTFTRKSKLLNSSHVASLNFIKNNFKKLFQIQYNKKITYLYKILNFHLKNCYSIKFTLAKSLKNDDEFEFDAGATTNFVLWRNFLECSRKGFRKVNHLILQSHRNKYFIVKNQNG